MNKSYYFFYTFLCSVSMQAMVLIQQQQKHDITPEQLDNYITSKQETPYSGQSGTYIKSIREQLCNHRNICYLNNISFGNEKRKYLIIKGEQKPIDLSYLSNKDYGTKDFKLQPYVAISDTENNENKFDARILFGIYSNPQHRYGIVFETGLWCTVCKRDKEQNANYARLLTTVESFLQDQDCSDIHIHCARAENNNFFIDQKYQWHVFLKKYLQ